MRMTRTLGLSLLVAWPAGIAVAQPAAPAPAQPIDMEAPPPTATATPAPAVQADASASVSTSSSAEPAKPWQIGIAPRLGFVVPTSKLGAMVIGGIELAYALPAVNHQLIVALDLSLTRPSYDGSAMDPRIPNGSTTYTVHETEMVVGATLGYRVFGAEHALVPWGALGPVLHMLKTSETTMLAPGDNTATSTELGLELAAGVDYRVGPGFVLGGARLIYSNLDHVLTGDTNAGKLGFEVGYRFVF
jgi:hypothetical protein